MKRDVIAILLAGMAMFLTFAAWALSSPIGSSPDDNFHLPSIWCAQDRPGEECEEVPDSPADEGAVHKLVPRDVAAGMDCYATISAQSASCIQRLTQELVPGRSNGGLYPNGFYAVSHQLVGDDTGASVLRIRLLNAALATILITASLLAGPAGLRRASALAWLALLVPLVVFLVPSTNPSGWAIVGVATSWVFITAYLTRPTWRSAVWPGAGAVAASAMALSSRTDAAAWLCLAIGAGTLVGLRSWRELLRPRVVLPALLVVAALTRFLTLQTSGVVVSGISPFDADEPGRSGLTLLLYNLYSFPDLFSGVVGESWGLGWIDTRMPPTVGAVGSGVAVALMVLAAGSFWLRKGLAVAGVSVSLVAVPLLVLQASHARVGESVQPRYLLPLAVVALGVFLYAAPGLGAGWRLPVVPTLLMAAAMAFSNAVALHANIRRYVTGTDVDRLNLDGGQEWWWDLALSPNGTWAIGIVGGLALFVLLAVIALGDDPAPEPVEEHVHA